MITPLNPTPYGFLPGEYCLIAYAAGRFSAAALYHAECIPETARLGDGDDLAEYHAHKASVALRRNIHFGLYCRDITNGWRNTTRQRINKDRTAFFLPMFTFGDELTGALADLGLRYMQANHLDRERW